jgi:hypothetical protein
MSLLTYGQAIWQGCMAKDDSAIQPATRFKYLEEQRHDIIMLHMWSRSRFINTFDSTSDPNTPNNLDYTDEDSWMPMPEFWEMNKAGKMTLALYKIQGVTKDQYGSPLGGCIVHLYRTLDDSKQDQCISDAVGNYLLYTPFADAHYCVAYAAGGLTGATVNTLTGS